MHKLNIMITLATIISIGTNAVMIKRNHELSDRYLEVQSNFLEKARIDIGDFVPPFPIEPLQGSAEGLADTRGLRVLQFVSMSCAASDEQMTHWWPQLSSDPRVEKSRPTLVSIDTRSATDQQLPDMLRVGNIVASADLYLQRAFRITSVPILIASSNGRVTWVHYGVLTDAAYKDLINHITPIQSKDDPA